MGRQVVFSALANDANSLLDVIRTWDAGACLVAKRGNSSAPEPLAYAPDTYNGVLILFSKSLAPELERRYVAADPPYYLLDEHTEPVLALSPSMLTEWQGKPALTQGRIYAAYEGKSAVFEKWYGRIVRYVRKNWQHNPVAWLGGYIGPCARQWFDAGGLLLPAIVPTMNSDLGKRISQQHAAAPT